MAKKVIKKLSPDNLLKIKNMGFESETEADAIKEISDFLVKHHDLDDMTDEPLEDLIQIAEALIDSDVSGEVKGETESEIIEVEEEEEEEIEQPKVEEKVVVKKTSTKKTSEDKIKVISKEKVKSSNGRVPYDGRNEEHVDFLKNKFSFVEKLYPGLTLLYNQTCAKGVLQGSNSLRSVFLLENIKIDLTNDEISFRVVYNGLTLFKGVKEDYMHEEEDGIYVVQRAQHLLPEDYKDRVLCPEKGVYTHLDKNNTSDIKFVLNKNIITEMGDRIKKIDEVLERQRRKMEESIEKK